MALFLRNFSAWLFYSLGISFFVAYVLLQNEIGIPWPKFWLSVADLPLLLSGLLYGGASLYLSVKKPNEASPILAWIIGLIALAIFVFLASLNFWEYFLSVFDYAQPDTMS